MGWWPGWLWLLLLLCWWPGCAVLCTEAVLEVDVCSEGMWTGDAAPHCVLVRFVK